MRVLVVGATGPTGRLIVAQALARGHAVTALARRPAEAALPDGARTVAGNVLRPETLGAALAGQDAVLCALGGKLTRKPTTMLSDGTRNLVAAMGSAGVRRLVIVTGIGAGDSRGHGRFVFNALVMPLLLDEIYKDKTRQEEVVRASGLDWTIVRPAELTNKPAAKAYRTATAMQGFRGSKVSRADVAGFMLDQLESDAFLRQAVAISD